MGLSNENPHRFRPLLPPSQSVDTMRYTLLGPFGVALAQVGELGAELDAGEAEFRAVREQLQAWQLEMPNLAAADVPVGAYLSGGLDSRILIGAGAKILGSSRDEEVFRQLAVPDELLANLETSSYDYKMLIQEFIPGENSNFWHYAAVFDRDADLGRLRRGFNG